MGKTNRHTPSPSTTGPVGQPGGSLPPGWRSSIPGVLPMAVFVGLIAVFDAVLPPANQLGSSLRFDPAYVNAGLSTVFISFTSFFVVYMSIKGYFQTGYRVLPVLGCAALAWGSASLIGTWLGNVPGELNAGITIANTGALFASVFHVASGTLASTNSAPRNGPNIRKIFPLAAIVGVLTLVTAFSIASLEGLVPVFYVLGVGQTPLRMYVLASSVTLFAISSLLFAKLCFSSRSRILYWYFLALGMTAVGLLAIFFGRAPGDPISWTGRAAQCLGGVYFLKAVLTTFRGNVAA